MREILKERQIKSKFTKSPCHYSKSVDLPKRERKQRLPVRGAEAYFPVKKQSSVEFV